MLTKNIIDMTTRIDAHRAADLLVQGEYFDAATGKGCFIGCLAHGSRPEVLAETYGIPMPLTRLLEHIFESLPETEAADFFTAIPRAIGSDSKDLTRVIWAFLGETLRALPEQTPEGQAVIDRVIVGMDLLTDGREWPEAAEAEEAAWAAVSAAEAARWAAEIQRQRDSILRLMAEAPIRERGK